MKIALRTDVDTFRGTRDGVPALCRILSDYSIQSTFFFSVGPDNMGRHLWRLARPEFLVKMLRSNAASLYGWDILLRGALWPGPVIGKTLKMKIRDTAADGHEIGFHAWDHYAWQRHIDHMTNEAIRYHLLHGLEALSDIVQPVCSAVPGWKCTDRVLMEKERFPFVYNSDCRGNTIFRPVVNGKPLVQPQVPVSLPTYDEIIGRHGITHETYNDYLLSLIRTDHLNVLTIHAEVEGIRCRTLFRAFLEKAFSMGYTFTTLGKILSGVSLIPNGTMMKGYMAGREGWVAVQAVSDKQ